jgi:aspartyl/asparaginyl-tRNA synthetase
MDLIIPHVGELIGGSQREENHEILLQRYARYDALPS